MHTSLLKETSTSNSQVFSNMRVLVTGTGSGLGKYLLQHFDGEAFDRHHLKSGLGENIYNQQYDLVIHCAFNAAGNADINLVSEYFTDNAEMTRSLLSIRTKRFVYASTIDLYKNYPQAKETDKITLDRLNGGYAVSKFLSESYIVNSTKDFVIMRLAMPVGPFSRQNNLIRALNGSPPPLSVSPTSLYNIVDVRSVAKFIEYANSQRLTGIYNIGSANRASIKSLAQLSEKHCLWGAYNYNSPTFNNQKACAVLSDFKNSSLAIAKQLLKDGLIPQA